MPSNESSQTFILPYLNLHLNLSHILHGFQKHRSFTSALLPLVHNVATGFNKLRPPPLCRVAKVVELSKAFDTVNHADFITALSTTSFHNKTTRWLSFQLRGRHISCMYNEITSTYHTVRDGVPQGTVISQIIFNFFEANYPENVELHTVYADAVDAAHSSTWLRNLQMLWLPTQSVRDWVNENGLQF